METSHLFTLALGLSPPWAVSRQEFDASKRRLDLVLDFPAGSTFPCPLCAAASKVHDTSEREWRHLNFFEHETFLRARLPRVKCEAHGVRTVQVPWARAGAGFTLLFEALVMEFLRNGMTMKAVSRLVGEHDTRLWRVVEHYVEEAVARQDLSALRHVGVDETSRAKGHRYMTLFADLQQRRVVFVAQGKDGDTLRAFKEELEKRGGAAENIKDLSMDMSAAFIRGANEQFPDAHVTFDKFHVIKLANEAVDQVRRVEQRSCPVLKRTRYLWLRNVENMTHEQHREFAELRKNKLETAKAVAYRELLQELYAQPDYWQATAFFDRWQRSASRCRLPQVKRLAKTLRKHRYGVLRWFDSRVNNGLLEGLASLVQSAKTRARGYRTTHYMRLVIHLLLSKFDFNLPRVVGRALPT